MDLLMEREEEGEIEKDHFYYLTHLEKEKRRRKNDDFCTKNSFT